MLFFFGTSAAGGAGGGIKKVADAAARLALAPAIGDFVIQLDTDDLYYFNSASAWELFVEDVDNDDLAQVIADLAAHLADTVDAHDASAISFTPVGTIAASDVQAAISEVATEAAADLSAHIADTTAAHVASSIGFTAGGGIVSTDVQSAISEVAADALADATAIANSLAAHLADTTDAHLATAIGFTPTGTIAATTVQAAIAEVATEAAADLAAHLADTTDAHAASAITFTPVGTVAATTVQAAIAEVASEAATATALVQTNLDLIKMQVPTAVVQSAGTLTPANNRRQIQVIGGNGGAVSVTNILNTNAVAGDELTLMGNSDTNTVTFDSGTNVSMNGSCTLGLDDSISYIYVGTQWKEIGRNA
jgi:hypothetical protein